MLFCGIEPLSGTANSLCSDIRMTKSEMDLAVSLAGMLFSSQDVTGGNF